MIEVFEYTPPAHHRPRPPYRWERRRAVAIDLPGLARLGLIGLGLFLAAWAAR